MCNVWLLTVSEKNKLSVYKSACSYIVAPAGFPFQMEFGVLFLMILAKVSPEKYSDMVG